MQITDRHVEGLREANDGMKAALMSQEVKLVERIEMVLGEFESRYGDLRSASADLMERYFRAAENAENVYFEAALALVNELLEQFGDDKLPDEVTDECRGLLADREVLLNSCATSHDTHLSKLLTVEEGLRNRGNSETQAMVQGYKQAEWQRNRSAIKEVRRLHVANENTIRLQLRAWAERYEDQYGEDENGYY